MRRLLIVLMLALVLPSTALAAKNNDKFPLHIGSAGPKVAALQWLLSGHKPNIFTAVKPTLKPHAYLKGYFGKRTALAVIEYKHRIGYPGIGQCTQINPRVPKVKWTNADVGGYFMALLQGHKQRPECWVALAANRTKILVAAQPTAVAHRLSLFEMGQVGVYEPLAYYRYNAYFRLPPEAWCAIFQGYSMVHTGLALVGGGNPWYVPSIIDWARYHGYLQARAKVGALVTYYGSISHIGYIIALDNKGSTPGYTTVEGNWANHVAIVHHTWGDHLRYFVWIPKLTGGGK